MKMEETIEMLKQKARDGWKGSVGEDRAEVLEAFLRLILPEYATALDLTQEQVLAAIEERRDYSAINYYQASTFPRLDGGVRIFETQNELMKLIPSRKFRCPSCGGLSTDPYTCDVSDNCDWKSYGLFKTMGKGLRFTFKATFLENPKIDEIFMPVELEAVPA